MTWKVTLPCSREEAEGLREDISPLALLDVPPTLMTSEAGPDAWQLDAYFEDEPDADLLRALQALVPSAGRKKPVVAKLPDEDWVTLSQAGIEPVEAGRFYVHTSTNAGTPQPGAVRFQIEAGRAFGTGTHETTAGCLVALDAMRRRGMRVKNLADIGTGTGLLAFAAMHLWPTARAIASDIDPASIDVTRDNAGVNGVPLGVGPGHLALAVAAGLDHASIRARAPYDLVIANILAGPLIELAPDIGAATDDGGTLILAGLIRDQAERVALAYRRVGFRLVERTDNGDWPTLRLIKRHRVGRRTRRSGRPAQGLAPGFGSW